MNTAERGFLLLCGDLADGMTPLSLHQLHLLRQRLSGIEQEGDASTSLSVPFFQSLGYSEKYAARLAALYDRETVLQQYLELGAQKGCFPLTCVSDGFPQELRSRLGKRCPAVLFYRGDPTLLDGRKIAVVGSRKLKAYGSAFAARVGELAAREGLTLVSGNAHGADKTAQEACLQNGGSVIAVVSEPLCEQLPASDRILYLAESGWHQEFSAERALGRNRLIHALGERSFVAQCAVGSGTWQGAANALKHAIAPVFVCNDGSEGAKGLENLGAAPVTPEKLNDLSALCPAQTSLFDRL